MKTIIIHKDLSHKILMIGVYYKNNAPGGMASVIQYYELYMDGLRYFPSWRLTNVVGRMYYAMIAYVSVLFNLIFDRRVKILHIHAAADGSFWRKSLFIKLGKSLGKKVVLHVHASRFKDFYNESSNKQQIVKYILLTDKLIVLSQSWREWFIGVGVPEDKIVVLNNITAYPKLTEGKHDSKLHFLFMGEIGDRKGVFDIIKAITNNREYLKDKIILRIGGNRNEDKLISAINNAQLQDFVKFEGWVAGDKKIELLNWADVYILPSFNEGLPIGILEAMSYNCAIISTPVGGIPEVVTPNVNGFLVTPGNDKEIAQAIIDCVNNREQTIQYGKACAKVVEAYLPHNVLSHLSTIYQELV
ncbi:MAG: glycosyltransferase family 4 protein [Rikenellaceae bacterium]